MSTRVRRTRPGPAPVETPKEEVKAPPAKRVPRKKPAPVEVKAEPVKFVEVKQDNSAGRTNYDRIILSYREKAKTPKRAIRSHCVECMGGMIAEVDRCTADDCSLWPFRKMENPFHKLSKHQKDADGKEEEKDD